MFFRLVSAKMYFSPPRLQIRQRVSARLTAPDWVSEPLGTPLYYSAPLIPPLLSITGMDFIRQTGRDESTLSFLQPGPLKHSYKVKRLYI